MKQTMLIGKGKTKLFGGPRGIDVPLFWYHVEISFDMTMVLALRDDATGHTLLCTDGCRAQWDNRNEQWKSVMENDSKSIRVSSQLAIACSGVLHMANSMYAQLFSAPDLDELPASQPAVELINRLPERFSRPEWRVEDVVERLSSVRLPAPEFGHRDEKKGVLVFVVGGSPPVIRTFLLAHDCEMTERVPGPRLSLPSGKSESEAAEIRRKIEDRIFRAGQPLEERLRTGFSMAARFFPGTVGKNCLVRSSQDGYRDRWLNS